MLKLFILFIVCHLCFESINGAPTPPTPLLILGNYSTNFDGLQGGNEGTIFSFVSGETIPGWYSSEDQYRTSVGSTNAGGLYSYAAKASDTDRALGSITSNKEKTVIVGISVTYNSTVKALRISLLAQQYRYGGDNVSDILACDINVMTLNQYQNGGYGGIPGGSTVGWVPLPSLSFQSLVNGSSNDPIGPVFNQTQVLTADVNVAIPAGYVLQIRWTAHDQRDGLAIDDFEMEAS